MKHYHQRVCPYCEKPRNASNAQFEIYDEEYLLRGMEDDYKCSCDTKNSKDQDRLRTLNFNHELRDL